MHAFSTVQSLFQIFRLDKLIKMSKLIDVLSATLLKRACKMDDLKLIKLVMLEPDFLLWSGYALFCASHAGALKIVNCLLQDVRVDIKNFSLRVACKYGHLGIVELLLSHPVRNDCNTNIMIGAAFKNGHVGVVQRLLQDQQIAIDAALEHFYNRKNIGIVDLIVDSLRIDTMSEDMPLFDKIQMIRTRATHVCIALQDFSLPALVTLEILDALLPNSIKMYDKWTLITKVKHWKQIKKQ